jgi:DNA helicase-2/ATP-dependent DNA helicase PcrA
VLGHSAGAMIITAGPGTGKTRTLTSWITHLIETGISQPENVLAITFTNRAAREMHERLTVALGEKTEQIHINTFHGFAFELIRRKYPELTSIYDEGKRLLLLKILFPDIDTRQLQRLGKAFSDYFEDHDNKLTSENAEKARIYFERLKSAGGVDISALIAGINRIFSKDPDFLTLIRNQFGYIAIDELQDINRTQYDFIANLFPCNKTVSAGGGILAIGDPDQAIYGFRGSRVEYFLRFAGDYKPASLELEVNRRSSGCICRGASALIAHNSMRTARRLLPVKESGEKIMVYSASDAKEEARFIASEIDELLGGMFFESVGRGKDFVSFSDIAVLSRTKDVLKTAASFLSGAGIPVRIKGSSSFLDLDQFSMIRSVLSFHANRNDIVALTDILVRVLNIVNNDEMKSMAREHPLAENIIGALMNDDKAGIASVTSAAFREFIGLLDSFAGPDGGTEIVRILESLFGKYVILDPARFDLECEKDCFMEAAAEYGSDVSGFLTSCSMNVNESEGPYKTDKVNLATFHASKGLEFRVVFIIGAEEGICPIAGAHNDTEEERRLFYVAMTRAMERLYVIHCRERVVFNTSRTMEKSRFIDEIDESSRKQVEIVRKKKQNKDYGQLLLFDDL